MFKSDSSKDWYHMDLSLATPISVTHEILQSGRQISKLCSKRARKQVNFQSYNSRDFRLDYTNGDDKLKTLKKARATSTYTRDFSLPYSLICSPKIAANDNVDPLFNRKPQNEFYMLPWATGKFMDDHFSRPSRERERINFFRQIRQKSYFDKTRE